MTENESIVIEKVNNGFIVKPSPYYVNPNTAIAIDSIFVFENFDNMVHWLQTHFTDYDEIGKKKP